MLSDFVTELLKTLGIDSEEVIPSNVQVVPSEDPPVALSEESSAVDRRSKLRELYQKHYQDVPLGATKEDADALEHLAWLFRNQLQGAAEDTIDELQRCFDALVQKYNVVAAAARITESNRAALVRALEKALPENGLPTIVEGASEIEAKPLLNERARIAKLVAPGGHGKPKNELEECATAIEKLAGDVESFTKGVTAREETRQRLKMALASAVTPEATAEAPDSVVKGATTEDADALVQERNRIALVLTTANKVELLEPEEEQIETLTLNVEALKDKVAARLLRHGTIKEAALREVDSLPTESDRETIEKGIFKELNEALATLPLSDSDLDNADKFLLKLREDVASETQITLELIAERAPYLEEVQKLRDLIAKSCKGFPNIDDTSEVLEQLAETLKGPLYEIDFYSLPGEIHDIRVAIDNSAKSLFDPPKSKRGYEPPTLPVEYLKKTAELALAEGKRFAPYLQEGDTLLEALRELNEELTEGIEANQSKAKKKSTKSPKELIDIVIAMRIEVDDVREEAQRLLQGLGQKRDLFLQSAAVPDPSGLPTGFADILDGRREAVREPLGEEMSSELTKDDIEVARTALILLQRDLSAGQEIAEIWTRCEKVYASSVKTARTSFQQTLQALRKAVLDAGAKPVEASDMPAAVSLCKALESQLEAAKREQTKASATREKLGEVKVGEEPLDSQAAKELYDLVGPDGLSDLTEKAMQTLAACFHKASEEDSKALRQLVDEGMGPQGKVLAQLTRSGDTESILALARGFAGESAKEDRARLRALIENGGLGDAPTVLDDLLSFGVGGVIDKEQQLSANVAKLKELGKAFGDEDGPARMKSLAVDCGLGRPRPETPPRPGVMAELLHAGFDGKANSLRKFADDFAGDTPTAIEDRKRLKGLVDEGGFGDRPKSFAPLVKVAGSAKLKEIGTAFKAPADLAKLKKILNAGGLSGDIQDGGKEHEHPDTLAKVFKDGLGQSGGKLKEFAKAFGDSTDHTRQCKEMMDAWNEFPVGFADNRQPGKAIGKLLKPGRLGNNVSKLQTTFATEMDNISSGNQRKLATRFAPEFESAFTGNNYGLPKPNNMGGEISDVNAKFILERHAPKHARRSRLKNQNSYFPVKTTASELANIIQTAIDDPEMPGRGYDEELTIPGKFNVEIAVKPSGDIVHCHPITGTGPIPPNPGEIATFTFDEAEAIFRSGGL
jgi:hypothetical protein